MSLKGRRTRATRKQPESLRLRRLAASLTVNDLGRSLPWYRDVLGFTVRERWEREGRLAGVELRAGSVDLYLTQDDFAKGRDRVKGVGFRLYCETVQDLDRVAADIKARGGRLATEPTDRPWGGRDFSVADPDGFQLTFTTP